MEKKIGEKGFTKKELNPVKSVEVSDDKKHVTIRLATEKLRRFRSSN